MSRKDNIISEKEKVIETVNNLFIYTDNKEWDKVQQIFAGSVLFDMTSLAGGEPRKLTPGEITGMWDEGLKKLQAVHHQTGNFKVEINVNSAKAFCYGTAYHYLPNDSGNNLRTFVGSYDFNLVKTGELWKIDMFRFNLKFIDGNKELDS